MNSVKSSVGASGSVTVTTQYLSVLVCPLCLSVCLSIYESRQLYDSCSADL